eukprot:CAMPEP_0113970776 /NCGR_PEP_ID=MMETSP0011_2-20120614/11548_1 /TAXON_ID=101924 /ORGANISM="Rhodosorus marinus" /LENGTH=87 /DNA_ID=CAMNT_0000985557 /DNA_START=59 /DNA_END=322 /DNA_ORIENTATION=+ /assembly_acc=CAM_ASM_000156
MSCVSVLRDRRKEDMLCTFRLSNAASASSIIKNGVGEYSLIAKRRASAAIVLSPPLSWSMSLNLLEGGMALYLIPLRNGESGDSNDR